ncbi:MAG: type II toxin-antitoxin system PemK/MazF family toxin [Clostridia bacterium]
MGKKIDSMEVILKVESRKEFTDIIVKYGNKLLAHKLKEDIVYIFLEEKYESIIQDISKNYEVLEVLKAYKRRNVSENISVHRSEIWSCSYGYRFIGEDTGADKCLIVQNNLGNKFSPTVLALPVVNDVQSSKHYLKLTSIHGYYVILDNIQTLDKARLKSRISTLNAKDKENVDNMLKEILSL